MKIDLLFISSIFIVLLNQFALARILKINPFLNIQKNSDQFKFSLITGFALIMILLPASIITCVISQNMLPQYDIIYLRILFLMAFSALFGYIAKKIIKRISPAVFILHNIFLIYIIITSSELSLVIGLLNMQSGIIPVADIPDSLVHAISAAFAFTAVLLLLAGISDRLGFAGTRPKLKYIPNLIIAACLLALAFFGLRGIVI